MLLNWVFGKKKYYRLVLYIVMMALLGLPGCTGEQEGKEYSQWPEGQPRPDVVVIIIDALRADSMSLYGYEKETTPYLRELAKNSAVFDYCIANALWTRSSIPSILTGLLVSNHGQTMGLVRDEYFDVLSEEHVTMPEMFQQAGYLTALLTHSGWYHKGFGLSQGFDIVINGEKISEYRAQKEEAEEFENTGVKIRKNDQAILDMLVNHADKGAEPGPLFSYAHLEGPHQPLDIQTDELGEFVSLKEYEHFLAEYGIGFSITKDHHILTKNSEAFRDFSYRLYLEVIEYSDKIVGNFIKRYTSIRPNTLFIITSDHGESYMEKFAEHLHGESVTPYNELTHIPLIFYWPGKISGRRIDDPVMQVDLLPTLRDIIGLEDSPAGVDGESLADLLKDKPGAGTLNERFCITEGGYQYLSYAVVKGKYKLIEIQPTSRASTWQIKRVNKSGEPQMLFDLTKGEEENIYYRHPEKVAEMRNYANSVLLGRLGYHLLFLGDGDIQRFSGLISSDSRIDRGSIRYHDSTDSFDSKLALSPKFNLIKKSKVIDKNPEVREKVHKGLPNIILEPGQKIQLEFDPIVPREMEAGKPVAIRWGFQFQKDSHDVPLQVEFRSPGTHKMKIVNNSKRDRNSLITYESVGIAGKAFSLLFENQSDYDIRLTSCFAAPVEASARAYDYGSDGLSFDFFLADGLVDLNWRFENIPDRLTAASRAPDSPSLYIWDDNGFRESEWPHELSREENVKAEPGSVEALTDALHRARQAGRSGVYLYRFGNPLNSRNAGTKGSIKVDKEVLENLKNLGYL
jgi:arylsulfatase